MGLLLGAVWAGCVDPTPDDRSAPPPAPPVSPPPAPVPPALADVQHTAQVAIDTVVPMTAEPARAIWDATIARTDGVCPRFTVPDDVWFDNCTTATGDRFSGFAFRSPRGMGFRATVTTADLHATGEGTWNDVRSSRATSRTVDSSLFGLLDARGSDPALGWAAAGLRPAELRIRRTHHTDGTPNAVFVDGGLGGLDAPYGAVHFDGVELTGCGAAGRIEVRTPGGWIGLELDPTSCAGCATAIWRDDPVGEVCVDFASWRAWTPMETTP